MRLAPVHLYEGKCLPDSGGRVLYNPAGDRSFHCQRRILVLAAGDSYLQLRKLSPCATLELDTKGECTSQT